MRTGYGSVNVSGFVHLVMMHALIQMILADVIRCHLATFVRMMRLEVVLFVINRTAKKKTKKKKNYRKAKVGNTGQNYQN